MCACGRMCVLVRASVWWVSVGFLCVCVHVWARVLVRVLVRVWVRVWIRVLVDVSLLARLGACR